MNEHLSNANVRWLNESLCKPPSEAEIRELKKTECSHPGWDWHWGRCPECGISRAEFLMKS